MNLDHATIARDLDVAYDALARVGQCLGRVDPVVGTIGRALQDATAGLADLRRLLDLALMAAGFDHAASPYYPARAMRPAIPTRIAAAQAQRAELAAEAAERDRRAAASAQAHLRRKSREVARYTGSSLGVLSTGDENHVPSLHEGAPIGGASSHSPAALTSHDVQDDRNQAREQVAATGPHSACKPV